MIIRKDNTVEIYHGVSVPDPYRWLEDETLKETKEWTAYQNNMTRNYFDSYKDRNKIKKKLTKLMNYPKYSPPQRKGDYYYFFKNDGLQNQPILYRTMDIHEITNPETVIDLNQYDKDGTTAITNITFNYDGTLLAYALSFNGSDWQEFRIIDLTTLEEYPEQLKWCKFSNIAWRKDVNGFFYNRYPDQRSVHSNEKGYYNAVYWHNIGTNQEEDILIYEDKTEKELSFLPEVSDDNKYLILKVYNGTEPKSKLYYRTLDSNGAFFPLVSDGKDYYSFIGNKGDIFYVYTNHHAPKGKLVAINLNHPEKENWEVIIPEKEDAISQLKWINHQFAVVYLHHASHKLLLYSDTGKFQKELHLPKYITITDMQGSKHATELFIQYASFLHPAQIIRYDFKQGKMCPIFHASEPVLSKKFETKQVFYPSKDGTMIPMFITHKKGMKLNGDHPTLLYGYGGYNISLTPTFSPFQQLWLEAGGVYAVANLRGGGEYGEAWHLDGILEKKQHVFDDFIAAAERLMNQKYTNPNKLAIMGGSNGGLLVGACITQRPELFGAALCLVPVTDMLRFHRFTVGRFWTTEFGNAEKNAAHFQFMYKYSPLHNVIRGTHYPATLITTADTDDRVAPLHAKKFTATLQEAQAGAHPILLRTEKNAGHGLGKPTAKIIEEQTDIYTFLFKQFDIILSYE